jgi:hypothetical protein
MTRLLAVLLFAAYPLVQIAIGLWWWVSYPFKVLLPSVWRDCHETARRWLEGRR